MYIKVFTALLALLFMITGDSLANDRARHDKLHTESATTVTKGTFEVDAEFSFQNQMSDKRGTFNNNWGKTRRDAMRVYDGQLGLTYGCMDNVDMTIRAGYADIKDRTRPFGDKHGRGLKDIDVSFKWRFLNDEDSKYSVAYLAGLGIPAGFESRSGHLGPGKNFWSFNQKVALTKDWDDFTMNADAGYSLPFGRHRTYYSTTFGTQSESTRGLMSGNVALGYVATEHFQPLVELNYGHEFRNKGNDSDLFATTLGAIVPLDDCKRVNLGYQVPFAGRNAVRSNLFTAGIAASF
jgi:hypothetical protein